MFILNLRRRTTIQLKLNPQNPSFLIPLFSLHSSSSPKTLNPPKPITKPQLKALIDTRFSNGKYHDLVRNVVASPQVLALASQNLAAKNDDPNWVPKLISVHELGREIWENRFDIKACCVRIESPSPKGEFLVLPNLKLKVVIEAVRMVLELVYDNKFVPMGRHTALRYLKNKVENPQWWFGVRFLRKGFKSNHVDKLCSVIGEKICDDAFVAVIKRLFECGAVSIRVGGCFFGRGFPQESNLSPILLNIYLDRFDRKFEEIRMRKRQEEVDKNPFEKVVADYRGTDFFFKSVKLYAVRYFDEIMVVSSGAKDSILEMNRWAVKYLESKLRLNVDRRYSVIHNATMESIEFLGMELQAVTPSILDPPMTEKAKRAMRKILHRKEVREQEKRNAREKIRKVFGLRILRFLFKKFKKRSDHGLSSDSSIANEVRRVFAKWGEKATREYLSSVEIRYDWHRSLTESDFLTLKHIREKLPKELIESHDEFRKQVDKHISPARLLKAMAVEELKKREEEEREYSKATIDDLTRLCLKIKAPIELVRKSVRLGRFTNKLGRPLPLTYLHALEDDDIIKWFAGIGTRWLEFYSCCHNYDEIKVTVSYHLRFSCLLTLAQKHGATKRETVLKLTKDLKMLDPNGTGRLIMHFPTEKEVKEMGDLRLWDPRPVDGALTLLLVRLASDEPPYRCAFHFCERTDTTVYRVKLLHKQRNLKYPLDQKNWVKDLGVIHGCFHRKCIPLCPDHIHGFYMGKITFQDVDYSSLLDMD